MYQREHSAPKNIPDEIPYEVPWSSVAAKEARVVAGDQACTTSLPSFGECLYMDVGLWAGGHHHPRHREFGVVCGNVALLCHYPKPKEQPGASNIRNVGTEVGHLPIFTARIQPFLDHLSTAQSLGAVEVLKALACDTTICKGLKTGVDDTSGNVIHVFLGDLHFPVMTQRERTFLLGGTKTPAQASDPVPRCGRLRVDQKLRDLAQQVGAAAEEVATWELEFYINRVKSVPFLPVTLTLGAPVAAYIALERLGELLGVHEPSHKLALRVFCTVHGLNGFADDKWTLEAIDTLGVKQMWKGNRNPADFTLTKNEAETWFDTYRGPPGGAGADVFEDAGADLMAWLELVAAYAAKAKETLKELRLVQVGDMYDLWIGLGCGFTPDKGRMKTGVVERFLDFWLAETMQEGPSLRSPPAEAARKLEALGRGDTTHPKLKVCFLRGNHDNYLKLRPGMGRKGAYVSDEQDGIVAEHGHATDGFNCDADPRLGWALTQLAYLEPKLRAAEPLLLGKLPAWLGVMRLKAMVRAIEACWETKRCIYVMGHTHRPMLKKITIKPKDGVLPWERMQLDALKKLCKAGR